MSTFQVNADFYFLQGLHTCISNSMINTQLTPPPVLFSYYSVLSVNEQFYVMLFFKVK
jgi:hypothetical protein